MADIFDVIADGTRRDILGLLRERDAAGAAGTSVSEIVSQIGVSQPTVSKHLKVLRQAALVDVREQGQHRFYSLHTAGLHEVDAWITPFLRLRDEPDTTAAARGGAAAAELPAPAAAVADALGRAAASVHGAWERTLQRLPGR